MNNRLIQPGLHAAIAIAAIGFSASAASAAFMPWTNSSGSTSTFSYSGGGSDEGLFGDPTVSPDGFSFTPSGFLAQATDGSSDVTSDRLKVTVTANPGQFLQKIIITELGDYNILGLGSVSASGGLFVQYPGGPLAGLDDELDTTPNFPVVVTDSTGGESGNFSGMAMIDLTNVPGGPVSEATIVFNNILAASAGDNGVAFIQKKTAGLEIDVVVPEPASLGLLAGFGGLLIRRRK